MDHLPIPESCKHLVQEVPYLGIAPKYDRKGFEGFIQRLGLEESNLPSPESLDLDLVTLNVGLAHLSSYDETVGPWKPEPLPGGWEETLTDEGQKYFTNHNTESASDMDPRSPRFVESLLQEWLWFGLLHEFELECGVQMDTAKLTAIGVNGHCVLSTKFLLSYAKEAIFQKLWDEGVPLDLEIGDWVTHQSLGGNFSRSLATVQVTQVHNDFTCILGDYKSHVSLIRRSEPQEGRPRKKNRKLEDVSIESLLQALSFVRQEKRRPLGREQWRDENARLNTRFSTALQRVRQMTRSIVAQQSTVAELESVLSIDLSEETFQILQSIDILCDVLSRLAFRILFHDIALESEHVGYYDLKFESQMKKRNWCPARTDWLLADELGIQYITSLLPSHDDKSHFECEPEFCARKARFEDFAQHSTGCDELSCWTVSFPETRIVELLKMNGLPGICKITQDGQADRYEIADVKGHEFVAISHVWAHGLGNPTENALPQCQLNHLFHLIGQLASPDALLWLDTLVVPTDGPWKTESIVRLREVYREASSVLVLDRYLSQVGEHWLEQRLQLLAAEWMMRLWTLQEGRLAVDLYIQFKDRAVPISELIDVKPTADQVEAELMTGMVLGTATLLERRFKRPESVRQTFLDLAIDLSHRSVSNPLDEPVCIATLLSMELEDFRPGAPTMKDVFSCVSELPQDIIFTLSPRLMDPGFRWAPSTFLRTRTRGHASNQELATLNPEGLIISKDAVVFNGQLELIESVQNGTASYVADCGGKDVFVFQLRFWESDETDVIPSAAIAIEQSDDWVDNTSQGILLTDVVKHGPVANCKFGFHVLVWRWSFSTQPELLKELNAAPEQTRWLKEALDLEDETWRNLWASGR